MYTRDGFLFKLLELTQLSSRNTLKILLRLRICVKYTQNDFLNKLASAFDPHSIQKFVFYSSKEFVNREPATTNGERTSPNIAAEDENGNNDDTNAAEDKNEEAPREELPDKTDGQRYAVVRCNGGTNFEISCFGYVDNVLPCIVWCGVVWYIMV